MKFRNILINTLFLVLIMCAVMLFMILLEVSKKEQHSESIQYTEAKASEYRMLTEQYKMETAKRRDEFEEARLRAFLNLYGGGK